MDIITQQNGGFFMRLQESGEMYLETILILSQQKSGVRAVDVGEKLGFSKPSVSRGVHILMDAGYVFTDENGFLKLSDTGRAIAEKIYARHKILSAFLRRIGVSEEVAVEDACKVEHYISDETYEAIRAFVEQHP
jgi:Mn-dependent DtxR family transcriptional regulator